MRSIFRRGGKWVACRRCKGTGQCDKCGGSGRDVFHFKGIERPIETQCTRCGGGGKCAACYGSGGWVVGDRRE